MDYSIALIVPSNPVCATARKVLQELKYSYPVFAASREKALDIAKNVIKLGTKLIISHGSTFDYMRGELHIPMMELPFTGLEAAAALREAFDISDRYTNSADIIHVGTPRLFRYLQQSCAFLELDAGRLRHYTLTLERSLDSQVEDLVAAGYQIFIGGFPTVNYAVAHGKYGIEFDVDSEILVTTIRNARNVLDNLLKIEKESEFNKAIMMSNSDSIITLDENRRILMANRNAERLLGLSDSSYIGKPVVSVLERSQIADISQNDPYGLGERKIGTPVLMTESPVVVQDKQMGSVITMRRVSEIQELEYQVRQDLIVKGLVAKHTFRDIVGVSACINAVKDKAKTYACYNSTVLIEGETGCGKELFAQSIHNASPRKAQPFVAINCATLPESLIESELFGYAKGAFTGAQREGKKGLFEVANGGTIFLDEISEIPLTMQAKLLRVLQEGDIIRVGGDKVIHVDVRIICSSNQNLLQLVQTKKFKADLFYRLNVLHIYIPPLRERREDIPALAEALLGQYNEKHKKNVYRISDEVMAAIEKLDFRGNIRELSNLIERMVLLCDTAEVSCDTYEKCGTDLYTAVWQQENAAQLEMYSGISKQLEQEKLLHALERNGWNKSATAKELGIDPSTLWRKLKKYGITRPEC